MSNANFRNKITGSYPQSRAKNRWVVVDSDNHANLPAKFLAMFSASPVAASTTKYLASTALTGEAQELDTFVNDIDETRQVVLTCNVNTIIGDVVLTGTNIVDEEMTETISLADDGGVTYNSTKMFKTLTQVDLPALTTAGDEVAVGSTEVINFPFIATENVLMHVTHDGTVDAGYSISANASFEKCTLTPTSSLDGNEIKMYFLD